MTDAGTGDNAEHVAELTARTATHGQQRDVDAPRRRRVRTSAVELAAEVAALAADPADRAEKAEILRNMEGSAAPWPEP